MEQDNPTADLSGFVDDTADAIATHGVICVSRGSHSCVSRVMRHGRWWALKSAGYDINPSLARVMLEKEFSLLLRMSHNGVPVPVELADFPETGPALVMEWIEGDSLDEYLKSRKPSRRMRRSLVSQLLDVLAHIHGRGIVHRDLKPSNILIDPDNRLHIIDFSLADDAASCLLKNVSGTPGYSAPEMDCGAPDIDWRRVDVFGAARLIKLIGGGVSEKILAGVCLSKNPRHRPASGSGMLALYRKIRYGIAVVMAVAALVGCAVSYYYKEVNGEHESTEPAVPVVVVAAPAASLSTMPEPVDDEGASQNISRHDVEACQKSGTAPNVSFGPKASVPDVMLAVMVAMDRRDSLMHDVIWADKRACRAAVDSVTSAMSDIGRKAGWSDGDVALFRRAVTSEDFYNGKFVSVYQP